MSTQNEIVGDWDVSRGEKRKLSIEVGSDPFTKIDIPLWIINGQANGPRVTIIAGIHGCEYASILAASRIFEHLKSDLVYGILSIIPVANPPAFVRRSRHICPIDELNLSRVFPGDGQGSISQRIASEICKYVVHNSDYFMDLHGGDLFEQQLPHTKYYLTGNDKVDQISRALAMVFTDKFYHPISVEERTISSSALYAAREGIPSIITEAGSEGKINRSDVEFHENGILQVLRWVDVLEDSYRSGYRYEEVLSEHKLRSNEGGFFIPEVSIGDKVTGSLAIGEIRDVNNAVVEKISSPFKGIVRMLFTTGVVNTGDPLMTLWETKEVREEVLENTNKPEAYVLLSGNAEVS